MGKRLVVDLQWFAGPFFDIDGGTPAGGGGGDPAPAPTPAPQATPAPASTAPPIFGGSKLGRTDIPNPLLNVNPAGGGDPAPVPTPNVDPIPAPTATPQATPEPELLDFGGRKVPVVDPVIKELFNDWQNLNRTYQNTNQKALTMEQQIQTLTQTMQMLQQAQQPQAPAQPQGPSAEELEAFNKQIVETFYEDPLKAQQMLLENPLIKSSIQEQINQAVKAAVDPVLSPIQKQQAFQADYQATSQKYPDFLELVPAMQQVVEKYQHLDNRPLEEVYLFTKGLIATTTPQTPAPTLDQMLADPNAQQTIVQNPQIKQAIINSYLQEVQRTQQQSPTLMGGQAGGFAPQVPPAKPKTIAEGSKLLRQHLFGGQQ